jgi:hypothetical protein
MQIQLTVIDQLGLRMYNSLPAVVSEIVANGWDADATEVDVTVTKDGGGKAEAITITDNGAGMTFQEIQNLYLRIGRDRRREEGKDTSPNGRRVMGHKGIGKLSCFGVAHVVEIKSIKAGEITHFSMDLDEMRATPPGKDYHPMVLVPPDGDDGQKTDSPPGTTVHLKRLKLKREIDINALRRGLARRFSILGSDFVVKVNGLPLTPEERDLQARCEYVWRVGEGPIANSLILEGHDWCVNGWIGTFRDTVPPDLGNGIVLMVRGKLAHEPSFYEVTKLREHALAYMVGEIHANFMDEDEDLIATTRNSLVWESEQGAALKLWLQSAVRTVARDWAEKREAKHEKVLLEDPTFKEWFDALSERERVQARKVIGVIAKLPRASEEEKRNLSYFVVESFEYRSFSDLVNEMDQLPIERAAELVKLFKEWRLLEAKEVFRVLEGRLAAIESLQRLIDANAREVPDIHSFVSEHPWIIDPTWAVAFDEQYYSTILKGELGRTLPAGDPNKRIDFVCIGAGQTVHLIELKRPDVVVGATDVGQLEEYLGFIQRSLGSHPTRSYHHVFGYLISARCDDNIRVRLPQLAQSGVYFIPYSELVSNTRKVHHAFVDALRPLAKQRPLLGRMIEEYPLTESKQGGS